MLQFDLPIQSNINTTNLDIFTAQVQPKEEPKTIQHKVIEGDNLTKIAKQYNTTWQRLWYKNTQLTNQDILNIGEVVHIPTADEVLAERPLYVLPVQENVPETTRNSSRQVSGQGNGYEPRNCTWYAKDRRPDLPNNLGDSINWVKNAAAQGFTTGSVPKVGSIGQQGMHVVYIEAVDGDKVYLSEMNYDYNGGFRYRWANASDFIYIY